MNGELVDGAALREALLRAAQRMVELRDTLNELDAAVGDGDCGLTMARGGAGLADYVAANPVVDDIGKYLAAAGVAFNKVAPSTLGTVVSTMLLRAGAEARGKRVLDAATLAKMLAAADAGVQQRGDVRPGDKTVVDALHPAAQAFVQAVDLNRPLGEAAVALLRAAREGRDRAASMVSKKGRGVWMGERSRDRLDPGTVMLVEVAQAALQR